MKTLNIKGYAVLLDDTDYNALKDVRFCASPQKDGRVYFQHWNKGKCYYLHRMLINPPKDLMVDHINRNTLDNTRKNLRVVTRAQNARNVTSTGVYECKDGRKKKWKATIQFDNQRYWLGSFYERDEALKAVDAFYHKYDNEHHLPNLIDDIV